MCTGDHDRGVDVVGRCQQCAPGLALLAEGQRPCLESRFGRQARAVGRRLLCSNTVLGVQLLGGSAQRAGQLMRGRSEDRA